MAYSCSAQGETASAKAEDFEVTLSLSAGVGGSVGPSLPAGPPAKAKMTAVELTLDICTNARGAGGRASTASAATEGGTRARYGDGQVVWWPAYSCKAWYRAASAALLIVRQKPATFNATLVLRQVTVAGIIMTGLDTKAQLFDAETAGTAKA